MLRQFWTRLEYSKSEHSKNVRFYIFTTENGEKIHQTIAKIFGKCVLVLFAEKLFLNFNAYRKKTNAITHPKFRKSFETIKLYAQESVFIVRCVTFSALMLLQ